RPMLTPATREDAEEAVMLVAGLLGHAVAPLRLNDLAPVIAAQGWTVAEINMAARVLASDPKLRDHIRFGGTITPADFAEVRKGQETTVGYDDDRRVVTTLSGFALQVRRSRLYGHAEALALWKAAGEPGRFANSRQFTYPDAMFDLVDTPDGARFKLK
ncbi:MAG: hypothetical protein AAFU38_19840, partial [Bacteroidota bacterium]